MAQAAEAQIVDEYDLQPGEMTKEQFAGEMNVGFRSVENWVRDKMVTQHKLRRRDPESSKIRLMPIFMRDDVDEFKKTRDAETVREAKPGAGAMTTTKGQGDFQNLALTYIVKKLEDGDAGTARRDPFIPTEMVVKEYGICEAELHRLESEKLLRRFAGEHGKAKWSRRQIEAL